MIVKYSLTALFLILSLSFWSCGDPIPEDLHLHYEGEWAIEKLVQVDENGVESTQNNPGTLILDIDPDKVGEGPASFNPIGLTGNVYRNLYAFQFMASNLVGTESLYWFTDENEHRIFLYGIGPLTSYSLVYTIQEQDIEIQRAGQMTWFIRMDDGRQETVFLKRM